MAATAWVIHYRRQRRFARWRELAKESAAELAPPIWRELEQQVDAYFRMRSYSVVARANLAHGVLQLLLQKDGKQVLAQCKNQPQRLISRAEIDSCLAASEAEDCGHAYLVTSGAFADPAVIYAYDLKITLVDGRSLLSDQASKQLICRKPRHGNNKPGR